MAVFGMGRGLVHSNTAFYPCGTNQLRVLSYSGAVHPAGQTLDALNDHRAFVTLLQAMSFCWTDRPRTPRAGPWFLVVAMMKPPIIGWPDTSERRTCVHSHDIDLSVPPK